MSADVMFGGYHSADDWGLILLDPGPQVSEPKPITKSIDIPGAKVPLDATESLGKVRFKNRTFTAEFGAQLAPAAAEKRRSEINRAIAGQKIKIYPGTESGWYWQGRPTVKMETISKSLVKFTITAEVEPYKYRYTVCDDDGWLWDPFDFVDGFINEQQPTTITESGTSIVCKARNIPCNPVIRSTNGCTVTYGDITYTVSAGVPKLLENVWINDTDKTLVFKGTGTVCIDMREETL